MMKNVFLVLGCLVKPLSALFALRNSFDELNSRKPFIVDFGRVVRLETATSSMRQAITASIIERQWDFELSKAFHVKYPSEILWLRKIINSWLLNLELISPVVQSRLAAYVTSNTNKICRVV